MTAPRRCLAIVLAAGEGKRMRSHLPKVLHELAGRSMLAHVLAAVTSAGAERLAIVTAPGQEKVVAEAKRVAPSAQIFIQAEPLGTAHAVLAAKGAIEEGFEDILVAFADTPLVEPESFARLRGPLGEPSCAISVLGFEAADPRGYGRLIFQDQELAGIREDKDLNETERHLTLCNGGLMAIAGEKCLGLLESIGRANAQGEYYLTDAVALARQRGLKVAVVRAPEEEVLGINDRSQLAAAEAVLQGRLRRKAMERGATFLAPERVHLSFDTEFGRDVMVEPDVFFGPGVKVGEGATIRGFSHLVGAEIGPGAIVGPFARLRPGAVLGKDVHIGNFVEVKASMLGEGVKANHLAYIGDATIGARTNIGAGAITCNYDGFTKFRTTVGEGVFIGVNSALVAPVTIGEGAYIGTGSVITKDVAPDALALARERQIEKPFWAKAFRNKHRK
ncbi:MAG TPA: bifunctional UDP-N-acetylglucosamine diphosphorylase/glucosamine-1-phosphate N-acetyltransferase GlmU [Methylovirgula sp.]|nr:bifunctional UDP-N-acetylglucosamine diphosphorylase/glucosamine-1-phosphate N-acetyltransferase GlmU [Methylovirgula sp.]